MSGTSYSNTCPRCGAAMNCYFNCKPHDSVNGQCLECGFSYDTKERQLGLKQVNRLRYEIDLPVLDKLKPQNK